jgi:hypothetical protein
MPVDYLDEAVGGPRAVFFGPVHQSPRIARSSRTRTQHPERVGTHFS